MKNYINNLKCAGFIIFVLLLAGCAVMPAAEEPQTLAAGKTTAAAALKPSGIRHVVKKGETLYRIAKAYNVALNELVRVNNFKDASKIEAGQPILIPGALSKKCVTFAAADIKDETDFVWPIRGRVISFFGSKRNSAINKGIDISAREGAEVVAAKSGIISFCDEHVKGLGKTIVIEHNDGFSSVYGHNSIVLVKTGDEVRQNQAIARVGSTGRASATYLHFEIRKGAKAQNPFYFLP